MKKKFLLTSFLVFSLIVALGSITKQAAEAEGVGHKDVIIGFKKFPGNSEKAIVKNAGGKVKYAYRLIRAIAASVPEQAIKGLKHNPNVTYVEDDGDIFIDSEDLANSWGVDRIDADLVWDLEDNEPSSTKGGGIHVAILDTGIDKDHPDLVANIAGGRNFVSGKGKDKGVDHDAWDDGHGHGTHCAGIVAADDNGFGVVGVAPDASLYGVKVLDDRGRGKASDFIAGLEWAVENGAQIVSISLQIYNTTTYSVTDACDAAYAEGLLLVSSAGNTSGGSVTSPADHPSVMAVSAIDEAYNFAWFSADGPQVELTAPGVDVYSTYRNGDYTFMDGTSMACPHVSGVAALVWASGPYENGSAVRFQLNRKAKWLDNLNALQQGNGMVYAPDAVSEPVSAVNLELSRGSEAYDLNDTAVLTAVVSNEYGNVISGLPSSAFETSLYEINDPDKLPIVIHDIFMPTGPAGTYTGELILSELLPPSQNSETGYRAVVTVVDSRGLSGTDEETFWVIDHSGELIVSIGTLKIPPDDCYPIGNSFFITVTVEYPSGGPVDGASVYIRIITASGIMYNKEGITDATGEFTIKFRPKKPDGKGLYAVKVLEAFIEGYQSGYAEKKICVQ
ncbi:S8 family serine peptidase [Acidobacteriota bacterium]